MSEITLDENHLNLLLLSGSTRHLIDLISSLERLEAEARPAPELGEVHRLRVSAIHAEIGRPHVDRDDWLSHFTESDWQTFETDAELRRLLLKYASLIAPGFAQAPDESELLPEIHWDWINADIDIYSVRDSIKRLQGRGGGILLYGPSGTGKTLIACHLAKAAGMRPIVLTPDHYLRRYSGETEQLLASFFRAAATNRDFLVFDDFEALVWTRTMAQRSWEASQLAVMLRYMQSSRVPFAATTNRLDLLDIAVLRRFVVKAEIRPMNREQRRLAFRTIWSQEPKAELDHVDGLAAGDFHVVSSRLSAMQVNLSVKEIVELLRREVQIKTAVGSEGPSKFH